MEPLLRALADTDPSVRGDAAEALGRLAGARAVEPLMARVTDRRTHRRLRLAAIRALGHLGGRRSVPALAWARDHECGDRVSHRVDHRAVLAQFPGSDRQGLPCLPRLDHGL